MQYSSSGEGRVALWSSLHARRANLNRFRLDAGGLIRASLASGG
jgi:hypothetical protein